MHAEFCAIAYVRQHRICVEQHSLCCLFILTLCSDSMLARLYACPTLPNLLALQIADRGVRALVKVLDSDNVVTFLNLQDNQVSHVISAVKSAIHNGAHSAKHVAQHLVGNVQPCQLSH